MLVACPSDAKSRNLTIKRYQLLKTDGVRVVRREFGDPPEFSVQKWKFETFYKSSAGNYTCNVIDTSTGAYGTKDLTVRGKNVCGV